MSKLVILFVIFAAVFVVDSTGQRLIQPTYRPDRQGPVIILPTYRPPQASRPIIRKVREADEEPQWLYKGDNIPRAPATGDHPFLPPYVDDVKLDPNRRYARSLDSPSAKRGGGSHTTSSGGRDTGATHPGYNRRNARSIRYPDPLEPLRPTPRKPSPFNPINPSPWKFPTLARPARDLLHLKKHVIIPNWNPHVRKVPLVHIGGIKRQ